MSRAYEKGAASARHLHRLFDRHRIVGAGVNPYRTAAKRAEWDKGFLSAYVRAR